MQDSIQANFSPAIIIDFWFTEPANKLWFKSTPDFDFEIVNRFRDVWTQAKNKHLESWKATAEGCLALTIVLDQFPLNMFRGTEKSFSTLEDAIQVTYHAISKNFDKKLRTERLVFLYMPLMHSESLKDQNLAVELFKQDGLENNLRFAKHHRDLIKKYKRFPHRNLILGRKSTASELEYLNSPQAFNG